MRELIHGTFHFHSTYSHDGRSTPQEIVSTLRRRGFSFCVMTEHFEDFDPAKFDRYVYELNEISKSSGFHLIPGLEVDLAGLHTIVFPVREYAEIVQLAAGQRSDQHRFFKVLAHPSKYSFDAVARHLRQYDIDGIEMWNQQADGSHMPPFEFLEALKRNSERNRYRFFFGCDIHNARLAVTNVISIPSRGRHSVETVVHALVHGEFVSRNRITGIEYRNGHESGDFDTWLQALLERSFARGKILHGMRRGLKFFYRHMPRNVQHPLNDVKNYVRNKI